MKCFNTITTSLDSYYNKIVNQGQSCLNRLDKLIHSIAIKEIALTTLGFLLLWQNPQPFFWITTVSFFASSPCQTYIIDKVSSATVALGQKSKKVKMLTYVSSAFVLIAFPSEVIKTATVFLAIKFGVHLHHFFTQTGPVEN